jgi:hypothetical protein
MRDRVFLDDLDFLVAAARDDPRCWICGEGDAVTFTPLCHATAAWGVEVRDRRTALGLRCWQCGTPSMLVAVRQLPRLKRTCRHRQPYSVEYTEGCLLLRCQRCEAPAGAYEVRVHIPECPV